MGALDEFRETAVGFDEVIAVTLGMRGGEANAFQFFDFVDRFEEVDEGGF
jgi:hypothetical protein